MAVEFLPTSIASAFVIQLEPFLDNRGSFCNLSNRNDTTFSSIWGLKSIDQINISTCTHKATLRGLHYQRVPYGETKLVYCTQGSVWDVFVDVDPSSPTYLSTHSVVLSPELYNGVLIPPSCAHGWQALDDNSQLLYVHSGYRKESHEDGIRFDDPTLSLQWPLPPCYVSQRDLSLPYINS